MRGFYLQPVGGTVENCRVRLAKTLGFRDQHDIDATSQAKRLVTMSNRIPLAIIYGD